VAKVCVVVIDLRTVHRPPAAGLPRSIPHEVPAYADSTMHHARSQLRKRVTWTVMDGSMLDDVCMHHQEFRIHIQDEARERRTATIARC
jgi:hypothetical protein